MEDILSPNHAIFDFDFSEFIDSNFDMTNEMFNSPNDIKVNSPSVPFDDLMSCQSSSDSGSIETKVNNYIHESPMSYPLWSSIEDLIDKAPPTLSCIDDFIKDPHSDLVQLVQQCHAEQSLFENLITHTLKENAAMTPLQVLQKQQKQQQKQHHKKQHKQLEQQSQQFHKQTQHHLQQLHLRQNFGPQLLRQGLPQHPLDESSHQVQNNPLDSYLYLQQIQQQQQQQQQQIPSLPVQPKKKKSTGNAGQKRVSKSSSYSSNNSNYTHSDSVNAQLLRELIRQAGRNNNSQNNSLDSSNSSVNSSNSSLIFPPSADYRKETPYFNNNGNYQTSQHYRHHPYYIPSLPASRHNLPYHIQTKKLSKPIQQQQKSSIFTNRSKSNQNSMGKPSMYSSDISQAQLLEIQAISRAQQDFIRAREQQEAEKEILVKHQQKKQQGI